jgi:hypothetical protein
MQSENERAHRSHRAHNDDIRGFYVIIVVMRQVTS